MKKKLLFFLVLFISNFFLMKNVKAFSEHDYINRPLSNNFEVALVKSDGGIETISSHSNYEEARNNMFKDGRDNLVVFARYNNQTKILDATTALVNLNKGSLIYLYDNYQLTGDSYTYLTGEGRYGAPDAAFVDTAYSSAHNTFVNRIKIGGADCWVRSGTIEIVPLAWVKSTSNYEISSESIKHNYINNLFTPNSYISRNQIGPKPEMLKEGTYYSYDGHYFYNDIYTLAKDSRHNIVNNSVNKDNPYYNYYMYLSNHTRTNYSSINIDDYIRNNMDYKRNVFGTTALTKDNIKSSKLYGEGTFFYHAQEKYGVNAMLALSLSRNETMNGRSNISIKKNNGFGLNAVDSSPSQSASIYATFSNSILEFANTWVTNGFVEPNNWRYFGSQFGNKDMGLNVKYASDVYWSEKMASNYFFMDKSLGFQDYNFYQLGVTTEPIQAMGKPNYYNGTPVAYNYKRKDSAVVILEEVKGQKINGNDTWYKIVSDANNDDNFKRLPRGSNYNWNSYAYVPASSISKINKAKEGYKSPNDVTEYQDKNYTYDFFIEDGKQKPKVAISTKNTSYYYDPTLLNKKNQTLLQNRYVMVYKTAYNENKEPVSYLVTSDYKYDQKHWVSKDSIKFVSCKYGQAFVTVPGKNTYTIVNPTTIDSVATHISGLYTNTYTPILEEKIVDGRKWYKVPVDLSGTNHEFGWTLAYDKDVKIELHDYITENNPPTINAKDITIIEKREFDHKKDVTAHDNEDGDITNKIKIIEDNVNVNIPGNYQITYEVSDSKNIVTRKTIKVIVIKDEIPIINANNLETTLNTKINLLNKVTAYDKEDGEIKNIKVNDSKVKYNEIGNYPVYYEVIDSFGHKVVKEIILTVNSKQQEKKPGEFYLNNLTWNEKKEKYELSGYLIILNTNNNIKDSKYKLILKDKNTKKEYEKEIKAWIENVPYNLGTDNGYDYSISWFKDEFSLEDIPAGDYDLYMKTQKNNNYAIEEVTNIFNKEITRRASTEKINYNFKVQLGLKSKKIELNLRNGQPISTKNPLTFRNMINNYDDIKFTDNKLNIIGTSYDYGESYDNKDTIKRELILEDTKTFKRYIYNIKSTNNGSYKVTSTDKESKEYAWYKDTIDVSELPIGTYSMIIHTKSNKTDNYGEINDIFGMINKAETIINNKKYKVSLNKERMNRIELIVENK